MAAGETGKDGKMVRYEDRLIDGTVARVKVTTRRKSGNGTKTGLTEAEVNYLLKRLYYNAADGSVREKADGRQVHSTVITCNGGVSYPHLQWANNEFGHTVLLKKVAIILATGGNVPTHVKALDGNEFNLKLANLGVKGWQTKLAVDVEGKAKPERKVAPVGPVVVGSFAKREVSDEVLALAFALQEMVERIVQKGVAK